MVILLAISVIFLAIRCIRRTKKHIHGQVLDYSLDKFMTTFLCAQCYYGISLQVAAFHSNPKNVNPLNGYAMMSVAVTGFLPTVFTFVLLQYYGTKSRYLSLLAFVSWLLATIVFFELQTNLAKFESRASIEDSSLRHLYDIPTCGGSSALALCYQTIGSSPLDYLSGYYNNAPGVVNLKNTNFLWVWSTRCLILCLISQFSSRNHGRSPPGGPKTSGTMIEKLQRVFSHRKLPILTLATSIFILCFAYQALMVWRYKEMDVTNLTGWTFGQILAVATWLPSILEFIENKICGLSIALLLLPPR